MRIPDATVLLLGYMVFMQRHVQPVCTGAVQLRSDDTAYGYAALLSHTPQGARDAATQQHCICSFLLPECVPYLAPAG